LDDTRILKQLNEKIVKYLERIKEKKNERSSEEERGGRKEEERRKGEQTEAPLGSDENHQATPDSQSGAGLFWIFCGAFTGWWGNGSTGLEIIRTGFGVRCRRSV
jgi:hypothetical protein